MKERLAENEAHRASLEDKHNHARLEHIPALERKLHGAQEKSTEKDGRIEQLNHQLQAANANGKQLAGKVHELEIALAGARATADGRLGLAAELRRLLDSHGQADQVKKRRDGTASDDKA